MGNTADFCPNTTLPADVGDFTGPIQTVNIITGAGSNESSISAEALYFIYGFGADGKVQPWVNPAHTVQRTASSFVQLFVAAAINVPPGAFKGGVTETANPAVADDVVRSAARATAGRDRVRSGSTADATTASRRSSRRRSVMWLLAGFDGDRTRQGQRAQRSVLPVDARTLLHARRFEEDCRPGRRESIGWFNGTVDPPEGLDVVALTIAAGDIRNARCK
jgi:hypothetical protein